MRTVPLFGTGIRAISDIVTRQRRVNCVYDLRKDQDRSAVVVLGTPGASVWTTVPASPIRGWHVIANTLYVCADTKLFAVTGAGVVTQVATGIAGSGNVSMADNSLQLMIVTGTAGYIYTLSTATLAAITDIFFPPSATSVIFLNGRFVVNKGNTREFYVSGILDGFVWTYLGTAPIFGTKENNSDLLVRVGNYNGTLLLWGQQSIEFWQDVGELSLPYQRINGATQSWGLAADLSSVELGNTQMFLGSAPDGGIAAIRLNGYVPEPVSDSDLNTLFSSFSRVDDAVAFTYTVYGHPIYQITFPTQNRSFAYDTVSGVWHEAQTGVAEIGRHFAQYGVTFNSKNYVTDTSTGKIYLLDKDVLTDDGALIKRQIVTRHIRNQGNEINIAELYLDFETGVGVSGTAPFDPLGDLLTEDEDILVTEDGDPLAVEAGVPTTAANPQVSLRISRDGGRTFGNERWVPLGRLGQYYTRVMLRRLGSARDFVVQITLTDSVKFVLASGSVDMDTADD